MDNRIKVGVRIRPLSTREIQESSPSTVVAEATGRLMLTNDNHGKSKNAYKFDWSYGPQGNHRSIYDDMCKPLVDKIFEGYNATFFAYGQTGSGKTYTMGTTSEFQHGVMPYAVQDIFQKKDELLKSNPTFSSITIELSYLEIYLEECFDLLSQNSNNEKKRLELRETSLGETYLEGLSNVPIQSIQDVMGCIAQAHKIRSTGKTAMNSYSSRSHAICIITVRSVQQLSPNAAPTAFVAKLNLVDLAGSERIKKTLATGDTLQEGIKINQGLSALGKVVTALSTKHSGSAAAPTNTQQSQHVHIPYRESKLTRLLKDSLGGNGVTRLLVCVSPALSNLDETASTLQFAIRTGCIVNSAKVNAESDGANGINSATSAANEDALLQEIVSLRQQLTQVVNEKKKLKEEMETTQQSNTVQYESQIQDLQYSYQMYTEMTYKLVLSLKAVLMSCLNEDLILDESEMVSIQSEIECIRQVFEVPNANEKVNPKGNSMMMLLDGFMDISSGNTELSMMSFELPGIMKVIDDLQYIEIALTKFIPKKSILGTTMAQNEENTTNSSNIDDHMALALPEDNNCCITSVDNRFSVGSEEDFLSKLEAEEEAEEAFFGDITPEQLLSEYESWNASNDSSTIPSENIKADVSTKQQANVMMEEYYSSKLSQKEQKRQKMVNLSDEYLQNIAGLNTEIQSLIQERKQLIQTSKAPVVAQIAGEENKGNISAANHGVNQGNVKSSSVSAVPKVTSAVNPADATRIKVLLKEKTVLLEQKIKSLKTQQQQLNRISRLKDQLSNDIQRLTSSLQQTKQQSVSLQKQLKQQEVTHQQEKLQFKQQNQLQQKQLLKSQLSAQHVQQHLLVQTQKLQSEKRKIENENYRLQKAMETQQQEKLRLQQHYLAKHALLKPWNTASNQANKKGVVNNILSNQSTTLSSGGSNVPQSFPTLSKVKEDWQNKKSTLHNKGELAYYLKKQQFYRQQKVTMKHALLQYRIHSTPYKEIQAAIQYIDLQLASLTPSIAGLQSSSQQTNSSSTSTSSNSGNSVIEHYEQLLSSAYEEQAYLSTMLSSLISAYPQALHVPTISTTSEASAMKVDSMIVMTEDDKESMMIPFESYVVRSMENTKYRKRGLNSVSDDEEDADEDFDDAESDEDYQSNNESTSEGGEENDWDSVQSDRRGGTKRKQVAPTTKGVPRGATTKRTGRLKKQRVSTSSHEESTSSSFLNTSESRAGSLATAAQRSKASNNKNNNSSGLEDDSFNTTNTSSHFLDTTREEETDDVVATLPAKKARTVASKPVIRPTTSNKALAAIAITEEQVQASEWMKFTVKDLKPFLQQRGLPVSGVKTELVKRLLAYEASQQPVVTTTADDAAEQEEHEEEDMVTEDEIAEEKKELMTENMPEPQVTEVAEDTVITQQVEKKRAPLGDMTNRLSFSVGNQAGNELKKRISLQSNNSMVDNVKALSTVTSGNNWRDENFYEEA